jgi:hypothetical protein
MANSFQPPSRTFYLLRSVLMRELGLARHAVRPHMALESLIPRDKRRLVWRALRREGLALSPLEVSTRVYWHSVMHVLHGVASLGIWCQSWLVLWALLPFAWVAWLVTRPLAVHVPAGPVTIRDAVIYLTSFKDGVRDGYRWSQDEISLKVRLIISESLAIPLERVTPQARLIKDLGMG